MARGGRLSQLRPGGDRAGALVWPTAYEIRDGSYRLIPDVAFPRERLRAALEEMRRFYRP